MKAWVNPPLQTNRMLRLIDWKLVGNRLDLKVEGLPDASHAVRFRTQRGLLEAEGSRIIETMENGFRIAMDAPKTINVVTNRAGYVPWEASVLFQANHVQE